MNQQGPSPALFFDTVNAYERSLKAVPSNADVQRDLAELCFDLARDDRARELYGQLVDQAKEPERSLFHERLALLAERPRSSDIFRKCVARGSSV